MKICMLTYYYWPVQAGGAENQCRKLVKSLTDNDQICQILTVREIHLPRYEKDAQAEIVRIPNFEFFLRKLKLIPGSTQGLDIHSVRKEPSASSKHSESRTPFTSRLSGVLASVVRYCNIVLFSLGVFWFLFKYHRSVDIIHVHTADWIAGVAAFVGWVFSVPVICKGADMPVYPPLECVPLSFLCDKWRRKPYFIALTRAMKENLIENGVNRERIFVIPNGVETIDVSVSVENCKKFLFIGNFSQTAAHKAFDILIQAWAKVVQNRPDAKLVMLGGGDIARWREYARQYNCAASIQFAGYQSDILPFIRSSCCLLLPSRKEGISNALLETQSYGLPAIVSDIPGNTEVVTHRKNGLVVPVDDVEALANAVLEMYDDSDFRKVSGETAKKEIEDRFSMEVVSQRIYALYCNLTSGDLK